MYLNNFLSQNQNNRWGFFCILLYGLLVGFQGFDLCDEGWTMTAYQQIFICPQSVEYNFLYYVTLLVGGLWEKLFGWGGYLSFRLLTVLVILCIFYFINRILSNISSVKWIVVLGFLLVLFQQDFGILAFHHNYLSALFASMIACFLYESLNTNSYKKLFIASVLIGINIFVRIPNITLIGLLPILFIVDFYYKRSYLSLFKQIRVSFIGLLSGVIIVLAVMLVFRHFDIFVSSLKNNLFSAASSSTSTHNLSSMFYTYIDNYYQIGKILIIYGTMLFVITKIVRKYHSACLYLGAIIIALISFFLVYRLGGIYVLYGISFIVIAYSFYLYRNQPQIVYLLSIALCLSVFMPLGSDFGIGNMGSFAIWWLIPLCLILYLKIIGTLKSKKLYCFYKLAGVLSVSGYIMLQLFTILGQCYFDKGSRADKKYCIHSSSLATTLTTKQKAEAVDVLLIHSANYIKEGDYVLFFQNMATLHYLTRTKPYLYNPWPWTYDADNMERQFLRAEKERDTLPVVIREKGVLPGSLWLEEAAGWNREDLPDTYSYKSKKIALINQFLKKHDYKLVWENHVFQIWLPDSM